MEVVCQKTQGWGFPLYIQNLRVEPCQKILLLLLTDIRPKSVVGEKGPNIRVFGKKKIIVKIVWKKLKIFS